VPAGALAERIREWFSQGRQAGSCDRPGAFGHAVERTLLNDESADLLKGLSWTIVAAGRGDLAPELGALAERASRK